MTPYLSRCVYTMDAQENQQIQNTTLDLLYSMEGYPRESVEEIAAHPLLDRKHTVLGD